MEKAIVIFRADRAKRGREVTAVFPEIIEGPRGEWLCYMHIGQHGQCNYAWYAKTRPATEAEYADLLAELRAIGYNNLVIRKRFPRDR